MRQYPATMATQHPDNSEVYINIQQEPQEAIHALTPRDRGGLGIEEIMIDFEGKLTPYHQTSQIAMGLIDIGIIPGRDVSITPRIPNDRKEPLFRQLMSIMSLVETNILAFKQTGVQAIRETVVPMIESGDEIFRIQQRIDSVIELGNKNYDVPFPAGAIRVIPLVETVPSLVNIDRILDDYEESARKEGMTTKDIRVMMARSDSAMSYGMISSVLAVLTAISRSAQWGKHHGVEVAPILGGGSLPFRGHVTPANLDMFCRNYGGIRTVTLQSGLRYDHGPEATRRVSEELSGKLGTIPVRSFSDEEQARMREFIGIFTKHYLKTFVKLAETVDRIAKYIPKNRDRLAGSKSALGYAREVADTREVADLVADPVLREELCSLNTEISCAIPRAISFTASMYTIGMPPEFVGVGRGLKEILEKYGQEGIDQLTAFYPQLQADLQFASRFVNLKVSRDVVPEEARSEYKEDFVRASRILLDGRTEAEGMAENSFYHTLLQSTMPIILHLMGKQSDIFSDDQEELKILHEWIVKMGKIRGSLG